MNSIDMYFINKANKDLDDEYLEQIEQADIYNLKKAKRNIILIPMFTFAITYMIKSFRDKIFMSGNYLVNIMTIRQKYKDTKYKSKTYEERKDDVKKMASPYKDIAEELKKAKEEKAKNTVEKEPEPVVFKQNPDPFQMRIKREGIIPASKEYSGKEQSVAYQNMFQKDNDSGTPGNRIMNKGSIFSNIVDKYKDEAEKKVFERSKISAEERDEKRERRFRYFKKININYFRDRVMKKRFKSGGWLFVTIPTFLSVIAGFSNYATVSFGVYLKYQAMIDVYYNKNHSQNENEILDSIKLANIEGVKSRPY